MFELWLILAIGGLVLATVSGILLVSFAIVEESSTITIALIVGVIMASTAFYLGPPPIDEGNPSPQVEDICK